MESEGSSGAVEGGGGIFCFKDAKSSPDPYFPFDSSSAKSPIVIDNGSYLCRMGWSDNNVSLQDEQMPPSFRGLVYKNIIAKTRKEKGKEAELQVASDIVNLEAVRFNLKTPFDRNVATQFETQETLLDYGFVHLGLNDIGDGGSVDHPIVMTEPLANPNACRASMNELLFEAYSVPKVAYGIDGLFSAYFNDEDDESVKAARATKTRLVISAGFHTVSFLPVVEGRVAYDAVRRLNIGGFHLTNYIYRSMQLKYPSHVNSITIGRSEEIIQQHCRIAQDYTDELKKWRDRDFYVRNVRMMQLPFTLAAKPAPVDPEVIKQRRQELAKRLVEMNAKKREERMIQDKANLKTLLSTVTLLEQGYDDKVRRILQKAELPPVQSVAELEALIEKTKAKIEKARVALESRSNDAAAPAAVAPAAAAAKRPRLREEMGQSERAEFDSWLEDLKAKRAELLEKRAARHHRKQQLAKRRTAASQERMRMISQLAKNSKKDDNFGMNDDDWDVYKKINRDHGDSDSEEEQERLAQYEMVLKEHDPKHMLGQDGEGLEISHDTPEWYQLHHATEQIKVPEILFQPSIIGHQQAGISETLDFVLGKFPAETQQKLVENVFVTGSLARFPGFKARLETDLLSCRPFKSKLGVRIARNPSSDAWNGARKFARNFGQSDEYFVTRQDYLEKGAEYLKEHPFSNSYTKTPVAEIQN